MCSEALGACPGHSAKKPAEDQAPAVTRGLPVRLAVHALARLAAGRTRLFKLKCHAIYPFMVKNTFQKRNVKYLEEVCEKKIRLCYWIDKSIRSLPFSVALCVRVLQADGTSPGMNSDTTEMLLLL